MTTCAYPHGDNRPPHQATNGLLCQPGHDRLEQHTAELPALTSWLHANLAGGSSNLNSDYTTGSREKPLPIKAAIFDHIVDIKGILQQWAALIAEERDLHGPNNTDPANTAVFILTHLEHATQQTWIADMCGELEHLHRTAHQLAPSRPATHRMQAPCPSCDHPALQRTDGDDYVSCAVCGRLWTEAEYARLCVVLAGEAERTADLDEWEPVHVLAVHFRINPATIRKWDQRGLMQSRRGRGMILMRLVCDVPTQAEGAA